MADDIGVNAIGQMETDGESVRIGVRVVVGNERKTRRVGEPHGYRRRIARDVRRSRERRGLGRRFEAARQQNALGVNGAKAGVQAEEGIHLLDQIVSELDELFVRRKRHVVPSSEGHGMVTLDARMQKWKFDRIVLVSQGIGQVIYQSDHIF